jgi:hypothetical protein
MAAPERRNLLPISWAVNPKRWWPPWLQQKDRSNARVKELVIMTVLRPDKKEQMGVSLVY